MTGRHPKRRVRAAARVAGQPTATIVTDPAELEPVLETLRQAGRFAFDTEFVMEDRYASEVCLIQVATEDLVVLIDPLSGVDDTGFWNLVADERYEKVVHSGAEDLGLCVQRTGRPPRHVFDLQIAAGLVGLDYPLSLMKLVRATCRTSLHKSQTLTDWRRRPLSEAQIQYAKDDVAYLPAAYAVVMRDLKRRGRVEWAREEFVRLEQLESYQRTEEAQIFRLKGAGTLDGRGLAIARELLKVREALGQQFNRPARVLVKDHLIVELARQQWSTPQQIRSLRGVQLSNSAVRLLAEAVERGAAASPEVWPELPPVDSDTPEESALISLATALVRSYCHDHDIAHQLAAVKQDVRLLVHSFTRGASADESRLAAGWRAETVGKMLGGFFAGETRLGIHREGKSIRMVLE